MQKTIHFNFNGLRTHTVTHSHTHVFTHTHTHGDSQVCTLIEFAGSCQKRFVLILFFCSFFLVLWQRQRQEAKTFLSFRFVCRPSLSVFHFHFHRFLLFSLVAGRKTKTTNNKQKTKKRKGNGNRKMLHCCCYCFVIGFLLLF